MGNYLQRTFGVVLIFMELLDACNKQCYIFVDFVDDPGNFTAGRNWHR